jgi:transposase
MRATPKEIREQIIEAKLRGEEEKTIIKWTKVSRSTITKVWTRYQKTGSGLAKAYTGRKSKITPEIKQQIRAKIKEKNDITLEELIGELDLPIKKSQLSKLLISLGLSFKKRRFTPKTKCAKM